LYYPNNSSYAKNKWFQLDLFMLREL
jgi:hypothetical protein